MPSCVFPNCKSCSQKQKKEDGIPFHRTLHSQIYLCQASTSNYQIIKWYSGGPCNTGTKAKDTCTTGSKGGGGGKGKHNIQYKPYVAPCYKDHDHKNMGLKRPMSPHLTVYAPTVPAMTSILERITGLILTFYVFTISCGTLFLSNGIDSIVSMIQSLDLSRPTVFILKILAGFPFGFHYFFGVRFVAWNAGRWLSMKQVNDSVKTMGIAAVATVLLFAML